MCGIRTHDLPIQFVLHPKNLISNVSSSKKEIWDPSLDSLSQVNKNVFTKYFKLINFYQKFVHRTWCPEAMAQFIYPTFWRMKTTVWPNDRPSGKNNPVRKCRKSWKRLLADFSGTKLTQPRSRLSLHPLLLRTTELLGAETVQKFPFWLKRHRDRFVLVIPNPSI